MAKIARGNARYLDHEVTLNPIGISVQEDVDCPVALSTLSPSFSAAFVVVLFLASFASHAASWLSPSRRAQCAA